MRVTLHYYWTSGDVPRLWEVNRHHFRRAWRLLRVVAKRGNALPDIFRIYADLSPCLVGGEWDWSDHLVGPKRPLP